MTSNPCLTDLFSRGVLHTAVTGKQANNKEKKGVVGGREGGGREEGGGTGAAPLMEAANKTTKSRTKHEAGCQKNKAPKRGNGRARKEQRQPHRS